MGLKGLLRKIKKDKKLNRALRKLLKDHLTEAILSKSPAIRVGGSTIKTDAQVREELASYGVQD